MKLEVNIPDELLSFMSEDEIKSKIEEFIKELSFEQKLKISFLRTKISPS